MTIYQSSTKGRKFVIKQLHAWIASEMERLEIATSGVAKKGAPIAYLEQFSSSPTSGFKDCDVYDCSMLFDIVSRSESVIEAYGVADVIIAGMDFTTAPFGVNSYSFNGQSTNVEEDDAGLLQRQPLRLEIQITINL